MNNSIILFKELIRESGLKRFGLLIFLNLLKTTIDFIGIGAGITFLFNPSNFKLSISNNNEVIKIFSILILLVLLRGAIKSIVSILKESILSRLRDNIRQSLLRETLLGTYDKLKKIDRAEILGALIHNVNGGIIALDQSITALNAFTAFIIYFLAINIFARNSFLILIFSITATLLAAFFQRSKSTELGTLESNLKVNLQRTLGDGLHGLKGIKATSSENWIINRFKNDNKKFRYVLKENLKRQGIYEIFRDLFILLIIGIWVLNSNDKNSDTIAGTVIFGVQCTNSLSQVISSYRRFKLAFPGYIKFKKIKRELSDVKGIKVINDGPKIYPNFSLFVWSSNERKEKISLKKGEILVIKGPSGSGKTQMIDNIVGFNSPDQSKWELFFGNKKIIYKGIEDYHIIKNLIGYAPQKGILYEGTLRENITMEPDDSQINKRYDRDRLLKDWLNKLNLSNLKRRSTGLNQEISLTSDYFSGGEIQRICLLRTWLQNKNIEILDEPTAYLDEKAASIVIEIIKKRSKNNITIIATHDEKLINQATKIIDLSDLSIKKNI